MVNLGLPVAVLITLNTNAAKGANQINSSIRTKTHFLTTELIHIKGEPMKSIGSKLSVVATLLFLVGLFASAGPLSATASAQVSGTQVTWLIGEKAIPSMQTRTWHGVTTLSVLASLPAPIIILTAQPDDNGIMNECATGHPTVYETGAPAGQWGFSKVHYMYRYTAECQLAIDLAATKVGPDAHGAIPGWVDWIM